MSENLTSILLTQDGAHIEFMVGSNPFEQTGKFLGGLLIGNMTDNIKLYRWANFKNGIGSVALVTLNVFENTTDENEIVEHYSGKGFTSQPYQDTLLQTTF